MDNTGGEGEGEEVNQSSLRLLILAPSSSDPTKRPPFSSLLHAITGVKPSDEVTSFSGYTTHPPLSLRTKYYSTDINIWCDELPIDTTSSLLDNDESQTLSSDTLSSEGQKSESEKGLSDDKPPTTDFDLEADSTTTTTTTTTLQEWTKQMLSPAASEVRAVIGGIILILPMSSSPVPQSHIQLIEAIHSVREAIEDESYHGELASIVVVQPSTTTTNPGASTNSAKLVETCDHLEEVCLSEKGILGWDFISWNGQVTENEGEDGSKRNEFGEKTGIHRAVEVLEGVDWSASPFYNNDDDDGFDIDEDDDDAFDDFGEHIDGDKTNSGVSMASVLRNAQRSGLDYELQREMMDLKIALDDDDDEEKDNAEEDPPENNNAGQSNTKAGDDDDDENIQVEQLQGLMDRVVAIRDAGSELPPAERGRFAKREINRIMRELGSNP